jgi:hypothetical protein
MPNYHPKTEHLPKQKTAWEHLPTKAVRVPEIFLEEIERYARSLDGRCSPFEGIISALDKLNPDELAQIKLAIESLSGGELKSVSSLQDSLGIYSNEGSISGESEGTNYQHE